MIGCIWFTWFEVLIRVNVRRGRCDITGVFDDRICWPDWLIDGRTFIGVRTRAGVLGRAALTFGFPGLWTRAGVWNLGVCCTIPAGCNTFCGVTIWGWFVFNRWTYLGRIFPIKDKRFLSSFSLFDRIVWWLWIQHVKNCEKNLVQREVFFEWSVVADFVVIVPEFDSRAFAVKFGVLNNKL